MRIPFVQAAVFLSKPGLQVELSEHHLLAQPAVLLGHLGGGPIMRFARVGLSLPDRIQFLSAS